MTVILAGFALVALVILFVVLLGLERRGDGIVTVAVILGLVVVEVALYGSQNAIVSGIFNPVVGARSIRLYEILIVLGLAARFLVRGVPRSISAPMLAWGAFFVWAFTAAVMGRLEGNGIGALTTEAKGALYLGALILAAGVPIEDYFERRPMKVVAVWAAVLAAVFGVFTALGVGIETSLPGLPAPSGGFGAVGADAATVFSCLGVGVFAYLLCKQSRRAGLALMALPLFAAGLLSNQRAALLGIIAAVGVLVAATLVRLPRIRVTSAHVSLTVAAALALVILPTFATAAIGRSDPTVPFAGAYEATFGGKAEQQSAEDRFNQWTKAKELIAERPVFGWGLGKDYTFYEVGTNTFLSTTLTHNIGLDLLLRTGAVGLGLFLLALIISANGGIRTWRYHPDERVAAIAAGSLAVVAALIAKGMVESIFEKYRLAVFLGISLGVLLSATSSLDRIRGAAAGAQERA
jgi:O-antigen ligase